MLCTVPYTDEKLPVYPCGSLANPTWPSLLRMLSPALPVNLVRGARLRGVSPVTIALRP